MADNKRTGLSALADAGNEGEDFSVIDAIGGPRGVIESMLPGVVFVVLFVATSNLNLTIAVSAVLAVLQVIVRLIQRQSVMGAVSGLVAVGICLIWAWQTHEARNYYIFGFITNAGYASVYIIFAMTNKELGNKGISAFIVEDGFKGFSIGKKEKKMGIRGSSTYELIFEDCRIPKENLLGPEGKGFPIAMHTLDGGRIGIAAQALGIAEGALERAIEYTKERKQFGRSIAQQQNTQFKLADMATRVEAAQMLVYKAAMAKATKKVYSVEAAKAKLFAAETAMAVTTEVVQLFGGYGYIREYDVERMMRDAKITEIYEGTSEVQRMVISGALLK